MMKLIRIVRQMDKVDWLLTAGAFFFVAFWFSVTYILAHFIIKFW